MRKHAYPESKHTATDGQLANPATPANCGLLNRLMTAFEVAEFVSQPYTERWRHSVRR